VMFKNVTILLYQSGLPYDEMRFPEERNL